MIEDDITADLDVPEHVRNKAVEALESVKEKFEVTNKELSEMCHKIAGISAETHPIYTLDNFLIPLIKHMLENYYTNTYQLISMVTEEEAQRLICCASHINDCKKLLDEMGSLLKASQNDFIKGSKSVAIETLKNLKL